MLSVIMLSVVMLRVFMLNGIILNGIILNVVAPSRGVVSAFRIFFPVINAEG